jgi:hypothetical protein
VHESSCKWSIRKYTEELKEKKNIHTHPDKFKKDEKIIDCRKMELLVQVLDISGYTPYQFIV